ncbi:hypothetical protein T4B_5328 [Trichinella pseudospiralis]|uniref:Uncharacterized protein n=1 Tax=Trichinella pseudospiralis TaxID=6337 RepID=A0A0V1GI57_TRIPS|nr:hypothetical protein T4B_5328 [Trichinella pseudospiralis]
MIDGSQQMMSSTLICFPPHHSDLWRVSSFLHWNQFHYNMRSVKLACAAVLLEIYSNEPCEMNKLGIVSSALIVVTFTKGTFLV